MNTNLSKLMSTSFKRTKHATTKLFSLLALLLMLGVNGVMGQTTIVQFANPSTTVSMAASTAPPTGVSTSVLSQTGMSSIAANTGSCGSGSRCNVSSTWSSATGSSATTYLRFTLTVATGYKLDLSSISITNRRTASGPDKCQIFYSANGAAAVGGTVQTTGTSCTTIT